MTSTHSPDRIRQVQQVLISIGVERLNNIVKFVNLNPNDIEPSADEGLQVESILVETNNKSIPYVEINRELELDKDGAPSFSFSLTNHSVYPDNTHTYKGGFGKEEILDAINGLKKLGNELSSKRANKIPAQVAPEALLW
jgi:hypothetical protein